MLSKVYQALDNQNKDNLSPLEGLFYDYLSEDKTVEDIVQELEDTDLTEEELKNFLDPKTEDLVTQLVINQSDPLLAHWLFKEAISDFNKEEIAYTFSQEEVDEGNYKIFVELYAQDYLSSKEKAIVLPKMSQLGLVKLALYYQNQEEEFNKILNLMEDFSLSSLVQSHELKEVSSTLNSLMIKKNLVVNENAWALYFKSKDYKEKDLLIKKSLESSDPDIVYYFLNQDNQKKEIRDLVIKKFVLSNYWSQINQVDVKIDYEVKEYLVKEKMFDLKKNNKIKELVYRGVTLASLENDELKFGAYYSKEAEEIIKKTLYSNQSLPEVIKGYYNFYLHKFRPEDKTLDILGLEYSLQEDLSKEYLKLKKFKPNVFVPAILVNKSPALVTVTPQDLVIDLFKAENIKELQEKFTEAIKKISESIKPLPLNAQRPFGVEVELCLVNTTPDDLAQEIDGDNEYNDDSSGRPDSQVKKVSKNWVVKWDGSVKHLGDNGKPLTIDKVLNQNRYTAEITTPKLYGEEGLKELKEKLDLVFSIGKDKVLINSTCGLHVHHDIKELFNEDDKMLEKIEIQVQEELYKIQESLYNLCSINRRDNHYCPRMNFVNNKVEQPKIEVFYDENNRLNTPRPGFNFQTGYGTLEFRMHEATLDSEQIVSWVRITHQIVEGVIKKVLLEKEQSTNNLLETLKLMEIEKLKKLKSETDLEVALKEINDFIKSKAWDSILVRS